MGEHNPDNKACPRAKLDLQRAETILAASFYGVRLPNVYFPPADCTCVTVVAPHTREIPE